MNPSLFDGRDPIAVAIFGDDFPRADVVRLRRAARAWRTAAIRCGELESGIAGSRLQELRGGLGDAVAAGARGLRHEWGQGSRFCTERAELLELAADDFEKKMVLMIAVLVEASVVVLACGGGVPAIPAVGRARARFLVLRAELTARLGASRVASGPMALNAIGWGAWQAGSDLVVQAAQPSRRTTDIESVVAAGFSGISGVVGGVLGAASTMRGGVGRAVVVGLSGVVGGVLGAGVVTGRFEIEVGQVVNGALMGWAAHAALGGSRGNAVTPQARGTCDGAAPIRAASTDFDVAGLGRLAEQDALRQLRRLVGDSGGSGAVGGEGASWARPTGADPDDGGWRWPGDAGLGGAVPPRPTGGLLEQRSPGLSGQYELSGRGQAQMVAMPDRGPAGVQPRPVGDGPWRTMMGASRSEEVSPLLDSPEAVAVPKPTAAATVETRSEATQAGMSESFVVRTVFVGGDAGPVAAEAFPAPELPPVRTAPTPFDLPGTPPNPVQRPAADPVPSNDPHSSRVPPLSMAVTGAGIEESTEPPRSRPGQPDPARPGAPGPPQPPQLDPLDQYPATIESPTEIADPSELSTPIPVADVPVSMPYPAVPQPLRSVDDVPAPDLDDQHATAGATADHRDVPEPATESEPPRRPLVPAADLVLTGDRLGRIRAVIWGFLVDVEHELAAQQDQASLDQSRVHPRLIAHSAELRRLIEELDRYPAFADWLSDPLRDAYLLEFLYGVAARYWSSGIRNPFAEHLGRHPDKWQLPRRADVIAYCREFTKLYRSVFPVSAGPDAVSAAMQTIARSGDIGRVYTMLRRDFEDDVYRFSHPVEVELDAAVLRSVGNSVFEYAAEHLCGEAGEPDLWPSDLRRFLLSATQSVILAGLRMGEQVHRLTGRQQDLDTPHRVAKAENSVFVGTVHRTDPDHPQSIALVASIDRWLADTDGLDRIIFSEGSLARPGPNRRESLAGQRGEVALLAFVAAEHGIENRSLEEDPRSHVHRLVLWGHDPETIFECFVLRRLPQCLRAQDGFRPDVDSHLRESVEMFSFILDDYRAVAVRAPGVDPLARFNQLVARDYPGAGFPRSFVPTDEDWLLRETVDVLVRTAVETDVQRVAADSHHLRDLFAASLIQSARRAGKAVYAAFGEPHFEQVVAMMPDFTSAGVFDIAEGEAESSATPPGSDR